MSINFLMQRNKMEKVGIIKEINEVGRLVIPKELRERYGLTDRVELIATKNGIVMRSPEYRLVKVVKNLNPKDN